MQMLRRLTTATVLLLLCVLPALAQKDNPSDNPACKPEQRKPERHEGFLKDKAEALKNGPIELVFIGDSITDAWRREPQKKVFDERWGKYNPYNIGVGGDQTQHVLWRIEHGELDGISPKLAVLMIGTNNLGNKMTPEQTIGGIHCVVEAIQAKLPETRLLLLGVFPRGAESTNPYRAQIETVNHAIAKLDDGERVKYLDIGQKFLDENGNLPKEIMPDALHPNEKGYQIWADAIGETVEKMMEQR